MSSYNRVKQMAEEANEQLENEKTTKIDKLWVFLASGAVGGEGIISVTLPDVGTMPLVTGNESNVELMIPAAERSGANFRIVEFSVRNDVTEDFT